MATVEFVWWWGLHSHFCIPTSVLRFCFFVLSCHWGYENLHVWLKHKFLLNKSCMLFDKLIEITFLIERTLYFMVIKTRTCRMLQGAYDCPWIEHIGEVIGILGCMFNKRNIQHSMFTSNLGFNQLTFNWILKNWFTTKT